MAPILGIIASSKLVSTDYFYSISTQTLSSASGGITISSIPQTYKHLQLHIFVKSDRGDNLDGMTCYFNSTSASSIYGTAGLYTEATAASLAIAGGSYGNSNFSLAYIPGGNVTSQFSSWIIDIYNYSSTTKNKSFTYLGGYSRSGSYGNMGVGSGAYGSTSAITSIIINPTYGGQFIAGSQFALYGIAG